MRDEQPRSFLASNTPPREDVPPAPVLTRRRATSLGPPEKFLLDQWASTVGEAFGHTPYLVGSVARGEDWRDVDVRVIMGTVLFGELTQNRPDQLAALNVAMSVWGQRATGLPIDFQFQEIEAANAKFDGVRNALAHVSPEARWDR